MNFCPSQRLLVLLTALAVPLGMAALPASGQTTPAGDSTDNGTDTTVGTDFVPPTLIKARETAGVDERLDETLPLDLVFTDSSGEAVRLGDYFVGDRPVVIQMAYYRCPKLCGEISQGMVRSLKSLASDLTIGEDFEVLTISFDARETPELAATNKRAAVEVLSRVSPEESVRKGWAHLVGDDLSIKKLTDALGYKFGWIEEAQQYSHPAAIVVATPDGRISRYLYGVTFEPQTMRLTLIDASNGTINASLKDSFILSCFDFNPQTGKYTATAYTLMRIAGVVTVITLASIITFLLIAERKGRLRRMKSAGTPVPEVPGETVPA